MSLRPRTVDFDKTWKVLKDSVLKIMTLQHIDRTLWDDHFSDVYALCVAVPKDYGVELHEETKKCLENHVQKLYQDVVKSGEEVLLETYYKGWNVYQKGADYVDKLFRYLNNQVIKKQKYSEADLAYGGISMDQIRSTMLEVGEMALDIWRRLMIGPMEKNLVQLLLQAIDRDREQVSVQQTVVHGVIQSFVEVERYKLKGTLDLYQSLFESKFLEHTSSHYKREANHLLESYSCAQYMQKVITKIQDEDLRSRKFLHPSSYEKVTKMCQEVMVASHIEFLHSVTRDMVQNEQLSDLGNMYTLVKPLSSGLAILVKEFENYVKRIALECVQNLKGDSIPHQFVEGMLNVHQRFNDIVRRTFQNDQEFVGALDRACLAAVNYKEDSKSCPKASEWLAKYTNYLLQKSAKGLSENEIEDKLTSAIIVFRYIEDKDIFQKFYSRMLAQRLIHGLSITMDAEEAMIQKLKSACGYEFTSKLQRMFTDIGLSKELTTRFIAYVESQKETLDLGFQIQVLQAGAWPLTSSQVTVFSVPRELEKSVALFEKFYSSSFTGRKLSWLYHWATADIKLNYLSKPYTITMTVNQAAILLLFNGTLTCTVVEIGTGTQLTGDLLQKNIKSLTECGLLKTADSGTTLSDTSKLTLNMDFTSKRTKFKISAPIVQKQTEKEAEQVNSTVQQDRKYFLECTIVRIMKTRKILKHNQLIQDFTNADDGADEDKQQKKFLPKNKAHFEKKTGNKETIELKRLNELRNAADAQRAIDARLVAEERRIRERLRFEEFLKQEHIRRVDEANRRVEEVRRKNQEKLLENQNIIRKTLLI